ncbi:MAG: ThiF family adenylyltransferase [Deltaproteobacteria bacterium]|nr:ThiF family adenylyltransferase [Deltaproteobacteria bacterium]MBI3391453.1 ThiF family adenylyltransferase [Deltaproteobacteria bacterium]
MLSDAQIERYSRQVILPEVGAAGQQRLLDGGVALVRSPASDAALLYLAASGVGRIGLIEGSHPRSALTALAMNPDVTIEALTVDQVHESAMSTYALMIDASGSEAHHQRLNRTCVALGIPFLVGAMHGSTATLAMLVGPATKAPCYACVAPQLDIGNRAESALDAATTILLGSLLAAEALKCLLDVGSSLSAQRLTYDSASATFEYTPLTRRPDCPVCGDA